MGKFSIIMFVVLVVWQIVSAVLQSSAKKQEQQRLQEMARRRTQQGAVPRQGGGAQQGRPVEATVSPQQTLADRRRAQLEELRARRQRRIDGPQDTSIPLQLRPGMAPPTAPSQPKQPASKARKTIRTLEAGFKNLRDNQDAETRRREADKRQRREDHAEVARRDDALEAKEHERRQAERKKRDRDERQAEQQKKAPRRVAAVAPRDAYDARDRTSVRANAIRAQFGNRATLQQIFVMKELLEPPLALRERPTAGA